MLMTVDKRKPFWDALRQLAPDISDTATNLGEVRRALRVRLDALLDRPLDDDWATWMWAALRSLYNESFR